MRFIYMAKIKDEKDKVRVTVYVHELPLTLKKGRTVPIVGRA